jgi:excisionase family DNA binding protein
MQVQKAALSISEAATFTGLSRNYLYKLVHLRKIPHYKPMGKTGRVFFKQDELENFIFRNRQSANYEGADSAE